MKAAIAKAATAIAGATLLSGCIAMHDHRGSVIDTELVSAIQPGVDNKDSVQRTLGRPTFTGEFGDSDWYYLSRDTETLAFRSPRVKDQTLLHVRFDAAGNVASIDRSGRELIAKIDPVKDKTPTLGRKSSLFNDLFGNIGTVNSAGVPGGGSTGPQ